MQILVGAVGDRMLPEPVLDGMHKLRYQAFRKRLQWDIPAANFRERDEYDKCNPIFILARKERTVVGCCRLLPSTGPYMLKNTFPQLLGQQEAPTAADIWEISRFAVTKDPRAGFGFSSIPATMIRQLVRYAIGAGITRYVFVTTTGFERLLKCMGAHIERFSEPLQIGVERSVALWMYNDAQTIRACGADARPEIIEVSLRQTQMADTAEVRWS